MQRPTAVPRMPASASGVSTQRDTPKRSSKPAVARKTPPARPTSSPSTITSGSRASSPCSAALTASTRVSSAMAKIGGRVDVRVPEEQLGISGRLAFGGGDTRAQQVLGLLTHRLHSLVVEQPDAAKEGLVLADAFARARVVDTGGIDVRPR